MAGTALQLQLQLWEQPLLRHTMAALFLTPPTPSHPTFRRLVIPHGGAWQYWLFLCGTCATTSRHRADQFAARSPRYGFDIGNLMLIFLIGLAFSVVAPLVLPATLLFFAVNYVFWRYVLLYVYVRKYESGGRMFPVFFNQLMICLAIFHVFTTSVMLVKGGYWQVRGGRGAGLGWQHGAACAACLPACMPTNDACGLHVLLWAA